ncbi:MAG TPA: DUF433 domain-containing protein [Dehalococcoidia bacterium]|nr:DUF433 domain-containing protein [Dehalococcoidia bacterium]
MDNESKYWLPLYNYAEADYLANVSRGTSKRWLSGYHYRRTGRHVTQPPVTQRIRREEIGVSFIDLVEIVAIGRLKSYGFHLTQIRQIVATCQKWLETTRPLVTLKFKIGGKEIFVSKGDQLLEVGRRRGMHAWNEILEPFLEELDYTDEHASRWWPLGKANPIVIDPDYGYGFPVIVNSGVRTETILERVQAGELLRQIAEDFNLEPVDVERALQFELSRAAA